MPWGLDNLIPSAPPRPAGSVGTPSVLPSAPPMADDSKPKPMIDAIGRAAKMTAAGVERQRADLGMRPTPTVAPVRPAEPELDYAPIKPPTSSPYDFEVAKLLSRHDEHIKNIAAGTEQPDLRKLYDFADEKKMRAFGLGGEIDAHEAAQHEELRRAGNIDDQRAGIFRNPTEEMSGVQSPNPNFGTTFDRPAADIDLGKYLRLPDGRLLIRKDEKDRLIRKAIESAIPKNLAGLTAPEQAGVIQQAHEKLNAIPYGSDEERAAYMRHYQQALAGGMSTTTAGYWRGGDESTAPLPFAEGVLQGYEQARNYANIGLKTPGHLIDLAVQPDTQKALIRWRQEIEKDKANLTPLPPPDSGGETLLRGTGKMAADLALMAGGGGLATKALKTLGAGRATPLLSEAATWEMMEAKNAADSGEKYTPGIGALKGVALRSLLGATKWGASLNPKEVDVYANAGLKAPAPVIGPFEASLEGALFAADASRHEGADPYNAIISGLLPAALRGNNALVERLSARMKAARTPEEVQAAKAEIEQAQTQEPAEQSVPRQFTPEKQQARDALKQRIEDRTPTVQEEEARQARKDAFREKQRSIREAKTAAAQPPTPGEPKPVEPAPEAGKAAPSPANAREGVQTPPAQENAPKSPQRPGKEPWEMTREEFNRAEFYQHNILREDAPPVGPEGFDRRIGPNAVPATQGPPSTIMEMRYGTKAGRKVYAVPKEAVEDSPNGPKIRQGFVPGDALIPRYDNQPLHELIVESALRAGKAVPEKVVAQYPHLRESTPPGAVTIRAYHGSKKNGITKLESRRAEGWGEGVYSATNKDAADSNFGFGGETYPVEVTLKNPFKNERMPAGLENTNAWKNKWNKSGWDLAEDAWSEEPDFRNEVLRELGYDGVISEHPEYGQEVVAFDQENVKIVKQGETKQPEPQPAEPSRTTPPGAVNPPPASEVAPSAPAAVEAAKTKEPWEMTLTELMNSPHYERVVKQFGPGDLGHRMMIEEARKRGLSVPTEVLAEYPDLKSKGAPNAEAVRSDARQIQEANAAQAGQGQGGGDLQQQAQEQPRGTEQRPQEAPAAPARDAAQREVGPGPLDAKAISAPQRDVSEGTMDDLIALAGRYDVDPTQPRWKLVEQLRGIEHVARKEQRKGREWSLLDDLVEQQSPKKKPQPEAKPNEPEATVPAEPRPAGLAQERKANDVRSLSEEALTERAKSEDHPYVNPARDELARRKAIKALDEGKLSDQDLHEVSHIDDERLRAEYDRRREEADKAAESRRAEMVPIETGIPGVQMWARPGDESAAKAVVLKMAKVKPQNIPNYGRESRPSKPYEYKLGKSLAPEDNAGRLKSLESHAADEDTRYAYSSVNIRGGGKIIEATDGYRAIQVTRDKGSFGEDTNKNLPPIDDIIPKVPEGEPPTARIEPLRTIQDLRKIGKFIDDVHGVIVVVNPDHTLGFAVKDPTAGSALVNVQPKAKELGGWNPTYLAEAIEAIYRNTGNDEIHAFFDRPNRPVLLQASGKGYTAKALIMPFNLDGATISGVRESIAPKAKAADVQTATSQPKPSTARRGFMVNPAEPVAKAATEFYKKDVAPAVAKAARAVLEAKDDIVSTFGPQTRTEQAKISAGIMREHGAELQQRTDRAEAALHEARKAFDRMEKDQKLDFIHRMEAGEKQADSSLDVHAAMIRKMLDAKRDEVRSLGKGKLEQWIENYFPHIWEDPKKAESVFSQLIGKRPLEGGKAFLKKRSIPTTKEGIEAGLVPVSDNPVDLALLKLREMDKYILAQRSLREHKKQGIVQFVRATHTLPEGYSFIDDKIATVYGPPTVKVSEYVDKLAYEGLARLAKSLGIKHERLMGLRGGHLGDSMSMPGEFGKVRTKFATGYQTLAHEIGHQLDDKYGMGNFFFNQPDPKLRGPLKKELRALADMRNATLDNPAGERSQYARKRTEQMANIVDAFIHMPDTMKEIAPTVYRHFQSVIDGHPELEPMREITRSVSRKEMTGEKPHGGLLIMGRYAAPTPVANVWNNYLSPGLRGKSALFRGAMAAGNTLNQVQLGVSPFHLAFVTRDAIASNLALSFYQFAHGQPLRGLKTLAWTPSEPIRALFKGNQLLKEWYTPGSQGAEIAQIVDAMKAAGGRIHTDQLYRTQWTDKMAKAWREGNVIGAAMRLPFSIFEMASKPILEYAVPRMKAGMFFDMARGELERLGPSATRNQIRETLGKAWDSIDNRMGQLVYDNLFWNKMAKDIAMVSFRSVGWNLGTVREFGGAAADTIKGIASLIGSRKTPELTHRMAYAIASPVVTAIIGGTLHYLMTGKGPGELKDYFYPKTGRQDEDGKDIRLQIPAYEKDIHHFVKNPVGTLSNKVHPMIGAVADMLRNKDFYGDKVFNEDTPFMKDLAKFVGKQFVPFSMRNYRQSEKSEAPMSERVMSTFGFSPANKDVSMTATEKKVGELMREQRNAGGRTARESERAQLHRDLLDEAQRHKTDSGIIEARDDGKISVREADLLLKRYSNKDSYVVRAVKSLPIEHAAQVLKTAENDGDKEAPAMRAALKARVEKQIANLTMRPDDELAKKVGATAPAELPMLREFHELNKLKTAFTKADKEYDRTGAREDWQKARDALKQYKAHQERLKDLSEALSVIRDMRNFSDKQMRENGLDPAKRDEYIKRVVKKASKG